MRDPKVSNLPDNEQGKNGTDSFCLREHPYPYRAMLSICSDLDETPDKEAYFETVRFLNTFENTVMGKGVGLEVGNTIYFDMPGDQFSYWGTDEDGRRRIRECIKSGHIDCIHSFGDYADSRAHAQRALNELSQHGCKLEVWIDHAVAPSNIGKDIMRGAGDILGSNVYHTDLTYQHGVQYIWQGRVTSIVGQNVTRNLFGIWAAHHPLASIKTLFKEMVKILLAKNGNAKYGFHAKNNLLRTVNLNNGQCVTEFMRCNPFWGGIEKSETAEGIADVLTVSMLNRLVKSGGYCILYTHLGKVNDKEKLFSERAKASLAYLAKISNKEKKVLVATTRRMLGYASMKENAQITSTYSQGALTIDVNYSGAKEDVGGLTFYVDVVDKVIVHVNGEEESSLIRNPPDHTGRESVSVPWKPLIFPSLAIAD